MLLHFVVVFGLAVTDLMCMSILRPPESRHDNNPATFLNNTKRDKREDKAKITTRILVRPKNITFTDSTKFLRPSRVPDIIFPDALTTVPPPPSKLMRPPVCGEDETFCENVPSYPYTVVEDILNKKSSRYAEYFGKDEEPVEISNRNGESDDMFICASVARTIFPKAGKTKSNKWKWIINQEESKGFIQGIRIETCQRANQPCELFDTLPLGYATTCKQKYAYRRLLSIEDSSQPATDVFLMPSACCCSYKRDFSLLTSFASSLTSKESFSKLK